MRRTGVRRAVVAGVLAFSLLPAARAVAGGDSSRNSAPSGRPESSSTYVVRPGDTIWVIAASHSRGADPLALVEEIESVNRVAPGDLRPGEVLVIPRA
jgi:LysM repeat protein